MRRPSLSFLLVLFPILLFSGFPVALADRGAIPVTPGISIYEPGQKAIIAWNGQEEILILSTDLRAGGSTLALEMMPLPSNPKSIEMASFESFVSVQSFVWDHASETLGEHYRGVDQTKSVVVTFHEKIGAHDITVVQASSASEFTEWADDFLRKNGIGQQISLQKFEAVIRDYMATGFRFFVLDLIEVSSEQNSVEPILYQFETSFLYYPVKISSPISGDTKIVLFLLTDGKLETQTNPRYYPFEPAFYHSPTSRAPIQFELSKGELYLIDLRIGELFENEAWLTVLEYEGPLSGLTRDLMIAEKAIATYPEGSGIHTMLLGMVVGALCTLAGMALTFLIIRAKRAIA